MQFSLKSIVIGVKLDFRSGMTSLCYYCNGAPLGIAFCNSNNSRALSLNTVLVTATPQAKNDQSSSNAVHLIQYTPAVSIMSANEKVTLRTTDLIFIKEYIKLLNEHDK